jgi:predicted acylesterase/phospholipase RssA
MTSLESVLVALLLLVGMFISPKYATAFVQPHLHLHKHIRSTSSSANPLSAVSSLQDSNNDSEKKKVSKRIRFMNRMGFKQIIKEQTEIRKAEETRLPGETYNITSVADLDSYFNDEERRFRDEKGEIDYNQLLKSVSVKGDTQILGSPDRPDYVHPVAKLLHERKKNQSMCGEGTRSDGAKVALVVEGGGMRGCVSAGMVCALHHLGLRDTVDVVYGCSAGSIIGAYFITGQLPWFGPEVYYDKLTTAGREFIDTRRLLRSLGLGLVDPRLLKDVLMRPANGKPVLNLSFLLKTILQETKPLDWDKFVERQKVQPLKVVTSGLKSEKAIIMDMESKSFETLDELSKCMHASCLLPGIAGAAMNFNKEHVTKKDKPKFVVANKMKDPDYEPLGDALLYGPMPYDVAHEQGATHVLVIRSRPDGTDVTGKGGVFERLIFKRYFTRKNNLPGIFDRVKKQFHKKLYAKNVIELNEAAYSERDHKDMSSPHYMAVALPPGSEEVTRLEVGRQAIFDGVRRGFARAYDTLVEDPAERGRGHIVAKEYFPDEIMDYDPTEIAVSDESAFDTYLGQSGISPKAWNGAGVYRAPSSSSSTGVLDSSPSAT